VTPQQNLEAVWNRAVALHKAGKPAEAEELYQQILTANPGLAMSWNLLGIARAQQARGVEALAAFDRALGLRADFPEAENARAQCLWQLGRFEESAKAYDKVVAAQPGNAEAWNYRGGALSFLERRQEALESFTRAVAAKPDYADALVNQGVMLQALERFEASLESFGRALEVRPGDPGTLNMRGVTLSGMGRFEEALADIERALASRPDYVEAQFNRAGVLADLARFEEAVAAYDRTLALKPDYAEAQYNRSLLLLLLGRYEEGWRDYEWRKRRKLPMTSRQHSQPHWQGEDIAGKSLLLYWEQGLGDVIQFCRFAPLAAAKGAKVFLSVQAPLGELLKQWQPMIEVIGPDAVPEAFDYQASLMSLPLAFGTTLESVPPAPYLAADPKLVEEWRAKLGEKTRPRIGLVWSGGGEHRADHLRSIPLSDFKPLMEAKAEFIGLQKELRDSDKPALEELGIRFFGEEQRDFRDTAALVACMNLVISVDTAVAHLAGAMGKKLWLLVPFRPDWRWLTQREDSVWYAGARLFRQPARGDWTHVFSRVKPALTAFLKNPD
jgi:tetratricopeptide (TPR) repeat protein